MVNSIPCCKCAKYCVIIEIGYNSKRGDIEKWQSSVKSITVSVGPHQT